MNNHLKKFSYNDHDAEFDFVREPEIFDKFDEKHTMDIELREQEIELLRLQENHNYEFKL